MCVAYPGVVETVEGRKAVVNFNGSRVRVNAGLINCKVGDRALVHAGCILQILSKSEAEELESLLAELSSVSDGQV